MYHEQEHLMKYVLVGINGFPIINADHPLIEIISTYG